MLRLELHDLVQHCMRGHATALAAGDDADVDALGLGPANLCVPSGSIAPDYTTFLNDLQRLVTSSWKKEVAKFVALTREPFRANAQDESAFWRALYEVNEKK